MNNRSAINCVQLVSFTMHRVMTHIQEEQMHEDPDPADDYLVLFMNSPLEKMKQQLGSMIQQVAEHPDRDERVIFFYVLYIASKAVGLLARRDEGLHEHATYERSVELFRFADRLFKIIQNDLPP